MIEIVTAIVHASSGSDGGGGDLFFLLAGPVSGAAFYGAMYRYYRHTDKSHRFEQETLIERKGDITGDDRKVNEIKGTRETSIRGNNRSNYRQRVARIAKQ